MMKPKTTAELAREPQDQQKVLEFVKDSARPRNTGDSLLSCRSSISTRTYTLTKTANATHG